tara:strand:+ start:301 stop:654 length:354 start_codon:yes stop_codon:yes gene_type:complete
MNDINTEELLQRSKWVRFIFMAFYAFILNIAVLPVTLILIFIQFLFHLVTGSHNEQVKKLTDWLISFFKDTLDFLTYSTELKPFPFEDNVNSQIKNNDSQEEPEKVDKDKSEDKSSS